MTIPLQQARALIASLQTPQIATLFAQGHAKHVLHEVREAPKNFPAFDPNLDDKVTFSAYALLAAGCSLAEQGERIEGADAMECAASLLRYVHGPTANTSRESSFHVLVSSMAFYAASHYSRAFVTIRSIEEQTPAARIVGAFLRKEVDSLINRLNEVLLRDTPEFDDQSDLNEWAMTVAIARAVALALEFIFTGDDETLAFADNQLTYAGTVASRGGHAAWWWVIRLLRLMLADLEDASLWRVLPPYFGGLSDLLGRYVRLQAFAKHPVAELWISQRAALPLALDTNNRGGVIYLRTSAGKTRVAELAILRTLVADPTARIFYLAPFRSLALEVEHTLAATFRWLGYGVSHLYGGSRVSSVDTELVADSSITIATPEKARALLRASPELFENVKLLIVDEGHLIGASERFVRNEVFLDHLRVLAQETGARFLLLSAVLPNPRELAEWVTGDPSAVAISSWKPSAERFGFLRWDGLRVRIDWLGDVRSFNPSFVEAGPLGFGNRLKPFPSNKTEAVAASAVRLSAIGPVMIFTGRAVSVPTFAEAVLLAFGEAPPVHAWLDHEWRVFEAICREELKPDAIELRAARAGVVCHSNRLPPQVRLALEHLMRSRPPRIIIATTTLGQGVNVGISTVIVANPYIGSETIDKRDFWNICGRAGRAYVDGEGKILYAIDETREPRQIKNDIRLANAYFEGAGGDRVESGLLFVVRWLRHIAAEAGVTFDVLLELAANNDFSQLGANAGDVERICDLLDDELLAIHADPTVNPLEREPEQWVEQVFRSSLAAIQARAEGSEELGDRVIEFLKARARSTLRRVPSGARHAVVSSGLPLSVAIRAHESIEIFSLIAEACVGESPAFAAVVAAVRAIEDWARRHAVAVTGTMPNAWKLDTIRDGWLSGTALQILSTRVPDAREIARDLYGRQLPWIIHAAAQQLRSAGKGDKADALARLALLVELGVPSDRAARIFLAGVRSRAAAVELAGLETNLGASIRQISHNLRDSDFVNSIRELVSEETVRWLDLMVADGARWRGVRVPEFPVFTFSTRETANVLHARRLGNRTFLATIDGMTRIEVSSTPDFPFDRIANDPRIAFEKVDGTWTMVIRDPRLEPPGDGV